MKYFTCVSVLLFLSLSNVVSAGLVSWSSHSMSTSEYFSSSRASNVGIDDCGDETYVLQIDRIKLTPDIIEPGAEITLEAEGTLREAVTRGAYADVTVKLGVVVLMKKQFDLCETLDNNQDKVDLRCPISEGKLKITQKITLPKEIPPAAFRVYVQAYTEEDMDLACFNVKADFRHRRLSQLSYPY